MVHKIWELLAIVPLGCLSCAAQEQACRASSCAASDVSSFLQISLKTALATKDPLGDIHSLESIPKMAPLLVNVGLVSTGTCSLVKAARDVFGLRTRHAGIDNQEKVEAAWKVSNATMALYYPTGDTPEEDRTVYRTMGKNFVKFAHQVQREKDYVDIALRLKGDSCKYIESFALEGWNMLADVPFNSPSSFACIDEFEAINYVAKAPKIKLVATSRSKKQWVASMLSHQWRGGSAFRMSWNATSREKKPELTAEEWGAVYDRHQALLQKHKIPQIKLEDSDARKFEVLCNTLSDMAPELSHTCANLAAGKSYPHWTPEYQQSPEIFVNASNALVEQAKAWIMSWS